MKINSIIVFAFFAITLFSCKKDKDSTTGGGTAFSCKLNKKVEVQTGYTDTSFYTYNTSNKVVKIISDNSWNKDTIIYNTAGKISSVNNYQNNILNSSTVYNYTGTNLTSSVKTRGAYTTTTYMAYSSGSLPNSIVLTTNDPQEQDMSIFDLIWSNGNLVSATYNFLGLQWELVVTSDNKNNLNRFEFPNTGGDFIDYLNKNNLISVALVNTETDGTNNYPAGTKLLDKTYTYTSNNEVSTISEPASVFNSQAKTTTCTFDCQ